MMVLNICNKVISKVVDLYLKKPDLIETEKI